MPGKGKYTTYNSNSSPRKTFLASLFKGSPYADKGPEQVRQEVVALGNSILRAGETGGVAAGDGQMFPKGVDLTYAGSNLPYGPPDGDVKVDAAGAPMNAFVPDVSSPGPGKTDGLDKVPGLNPKLKPEEYKPGYVESANTRLPVESSARVYSANVLGDDNLFNTTEPVQIPV
jgi:hypothetical protein